MFEDLSLADQRQLFQGCLIFFNKRPVKVLRISEDKNYNLLDIKSQKKEVKSYEEVIKHATPPYRRLGMVNIDGGAFWSERIPQRQFSIGFSIGNIRVNALSVGKYIDPPRESIEKIRNLQCVELYDTLMNIYPSFEEALATVAEFGGTVAFDKQFAVSETGYVFYKTALVGSVAPKKKKVQDIKFKNGLEHLILLLDKNHEKDLRAFEIK